jgi:hypothetical protein
MRQFATVVHNFGITNSYPGKAETSEFDFLAAFRAAHQMHGKPLIVLNSLFPVELWLVNAIVYGIASYMPKISVNCNLSNILNFKVLALSFANLSVEFFPFIVTTGCAGNSLR